MLAMFCSIGVALRANLEGMDAGTFKRGDRNYDIAVEFEDRLGMRILHSYP